MPDAFFASSKTRKRKRSASREQGPSTSKKAARTNSTSFAKGGKGKKRAAAPPTKRKAADEELSDATQDEASDVDVDDMDLRAPDVDPNAYESGEEDEEETEAEKRLRLAKLYLQEVKEGLSLGVCSFCHIRAICMYSHAVFVTADGEFDAAEIDKELISARLKQDVLEHSGKVYLFVADSVRVHRILLTSIPRRADKTGFVVRSLEPANAAHTRTSVLRDVCSSVRRRAVALYLGQGRLHH